VTDDLARFLITVWPLAGHCFPNLAVARALRNLGHEVAFYSGEQAEKNIRGEGFDFFPFRRVESAWFHDIFFKPSPNTPGTLKFSIEQSRRYKELMSGKIADQVLDINETIDAWSPDVLITDPLMWASYLVVKDQRALKTAIFVYLPFCLVPSPDIPPIGLGLAPSHGLGGRIRNFVWGRVIYSMTAGGRRAANAVRAKFGIKPLSETVAEYGGKMDLYLVAGSRETDYNRTVPSPNIHYVGPCLWSKPSTAATPEWMLKLKPGHPVVHVTEGTIHVDAPVVLKAAAEGLAGMDVQVVMATGSHRKPEEMGLDPLAPNIRVESWLSYDDLLPRTDLVITTCGAGTALAALSHGIPMIVIPTEWDKPEVARRLAEAGAALFLKPAECTPRRLRQAVETVLGNPSFRENARRLQASLARHGGAAEAAELLSELAGKAAA
jgi:UDP:flavonoid glycosyltransferase YjiC (YdhE family)